MGFYMVLESNQCTNTPIVPFHVTKNNLCVIVGVNNIIVHWLHEWAHTTYSLDIHFWDNHKLLNYLLSIS